MHSKYLRYGFLFILGGLWFLAGAIQIEATILVRKDFNNLVEEAELILAGTVINKESVWADDMSTIYTFVTLSDLEVIDGEYEGTEFTLRLEGGEVEQGGGKGKGLKIPGVPEFTLNERVVVFIKGNTTSLCPLVGWEQGVLRVKEDTETGEQRLFSASSDYEIADIDEKGEFLFKHSEMQPQNLGIEIEEDDIMAKELRLKHEEDLEWKRRELRDKKFLLGDLKGKIKDKVQELKGQGKKPLKKAISADINLHRTGEANLPAVGYEKVQVK